jgi:membrane protein
VPRLAAALAYYTAFSLAPLLVIVVAVAGIAFGADEVRTALVGQIRDMLGGEGGDLVLSMLQQASRPKESIIAMVIGVGTLILGASGLFGQLQDALNTVWEVQPKPGRGLRGMVRDRFLSFAMVLGVGFLLLVSLVLSAALHGLQRYAGGRFAALAPVLQAGGFVIDLALTSLLFAMMYKFLPDVRLRWRDVWTGAVATAALFTLGKFAIGLYLGRSAVGSAYGAAGSLAIVLFWVYYSSQILLFGAEFTQVYARRRGSWVVPKENAERARRGPASTPAPRPLPAPPPPPAVEPQVVRPEPQPPAYVGGIALGLVAGFLNDRLRQRLRAYGRMLERPPR